MIILAAAVFFNSGIEVTELEQAQELLTPMVGALAGVVFGVALLFAGIASSVTSGMAGGSIMAGMFGKTYDTTNTATRVGIISTLALALPIIFLMGTDYLQALILSQVFLSVQLPITVFLLLYLTTSKKVMGEHRNSLKLNICL